MFVEFFPVQFSIPMQCKGELLLKIVWTWKLSWVTSLNLDFLTIWFSLLLESPCPSVCPFVTKFSASYTSGSGIIDVCIIHTCIKIKDHMYGYMHHGHICVGHTAWAPEGREGRSQGGPKGHTLEVGARRAPKLLVFYIYYKQACKSQRCNSSDSPMMPNNALIAYWEKKLSSVETNSRGWIKYRLWGFDGGWGKATAPLSLFCRQTKQHPSRF